VFKRLLVPLDGSSLAETVLPLARYIAERVQATLILFHVVEKHAPSEIHGQRHLRGVAEAKTYIEKLAASLSAAGLNSEQHVHEVQEGGVAQLISGHAVELKADLILLCAHGHGGFRDLLFGSIAQQVIRQGTMPVLLVRPEGMPDIIAHPIRQILVPLDGAKGHEAAIEVASDLAEQLNASLKLLTVVPTSETLDMKEALTGRVSPRTTMLSLDIAAQQADDYLSQIAKSLSARKLVVSKTLLRGDPAPLLLDTINGEGVDMVVMATHGHSALDARWEGSLTPRFLPKATVPVMLVRGYASDED